MSVTAAILVPAKDEAERVGTVVSVALEADIGPVLVVDDGSRDGTTDAAERAGARVLTLATNVGKGGALVAGARHLDADVLVLLDADLLGLAARHVRALAGPVVDGTVEMTRGVFSGARWRTSAAQRLAPALGGQRGLKRRMLLEIPHLDTSRYGTELLIERHVRRRSLRRCDVDLDGVGQVMKEEKVGFFRGVTARAAMYGDLLATVWTRSKR